MIDCKVNKNVEVGTKIIFNLGSKTIDGIILEKTSMSKGDIGFLIQTDAGVCRIKHRQLDLYHILN